MNEVINEHGYELGIPTLCISPFSSVKHKTLGPDHKKLQWDQPAGSFQQETQSDLINLSSVIRSFGGHDVG